MVSYHLQLKLMGTNSQLLILNVKYIGLITCNSIYTYYVVEISLVNDLVLKWDKLKIRFWVKQHNRIRKFRLTTLITEVILHKAYTRVSPADRFGPWLNNALIPAGNGRSMPIGGIDKTKKIASRDMEYSWSRRSKTKLKSPKRRMEMIKPTRSWKARKAEERGNISMSIGWLKYTQHPMY